MVRAAGPALTCAHEIDLRERLRIDPFQDPRPDIKRWMEPMRSQLRQALHMLDYAERHPWSG